MYLAGLRLCGIGPFRDVKLSFCDELGVPRKVNIVFGGGGIGKTSLLGALSTTRPGHCVAQLPPPSWMQVPGNGYGAQRLVVSEWVLGADDPARPHPLILASPHVHVYADEQLETLRRREQLLFDREAKAGGFAFAAISGARWFSRQPVHLIPLGRQPGYDSRPAFGVDEASRCDLTRETKAALAYAEVTSALSTRSAMENLGLPALGYAMRSAVDRLVGLQSYRYTGLDPSSFEPEFLDPAGNELRFDMLPTQIKHLVSFATSSVKALWLARPGTDPRVAEGVIAIDDIDLHLSEGVQECLLAELSAALPNIQYIVTTSSPVIASSADARDVIALRRSSEEGQVEIHTGHAARVH